MTSSKMIILSCHNLNYRSRWYRLQWIKKYKYGIASKAQKLCQFFLKIRSAMSSYYTTVRIVVRPLTDGVTIAWLKDETDRRTRRVHKVFSTSAEVQRKSEN